MSEQAKPNPDAAGPAEAAQVPASVPAPVPAATTAMAMVPRSQAPTRRASVSRSASAALWRRALSFCAVTGVVAGALWWMLAPSGAFYGDGKDYATWFPRDAMLALLLAIAGLVSAVLATRRISSPARRADVKAAPPSTAVALALAVGGLAGSVIAWRVGVFAGDLFRTPEANLPNPSILFSLRSGSVLLLWPLTSMLVVFLQNFLSSMVPSSHTGAAASASSRRGRMHTDAGVNG